MRYWWYITMTIKNHGLFQGYTEIRLKCPLVDLKYMWPLLFSCFISMIPNTTRKDGHMSSCSSQRVMRVSSSDPVSVLTTALSVQRTGKSWHLESNIIRLCPLVSHHFASPQAHIILNKTVYHSTANQILQCVNYNTL